MEPGTRLEHYEIVDKLGEGGMGAVYRAEDTRLKRQVAIKVLPPEVSLDEERLARLEREAQLLASLNHANVATVHGFGTEEIAEESGPRQVSFLVMELVDGPSLYERIAGGPLPWREAVDIAIGIAAGLEAAHERGIVHRDLKPGNVHLAPDDTVKVLDFGLAKAFEGDGTGSGSLEMSASPTVAAATRTGMILGTAAYMSPEQARGKPVDKRADIWALGCVLYEMLAGRKAFEGETVSDVLAAILKEQPDTDALPPIPERLRHVLDRCLDKDPNRRMRDVADVRIELEVARQERARAGAAAAAVPSWRLALPLGLAAALAGALAGWGIWGGSSMGPELRVLLAPEAIAGGSTPLAISPDGLMVAENGRRAGIRLRMMSELEGRYLPDTEGGLQAVAFSADGRRIYFSRGSEVLSIGVEGSSPVVEASLEAGNVTGLFRGLDGDMFAAVSQGQNGRVLRLQPNGGFTESWTGEHGGRFAVLTSQLADSLWLGHNWTGVGQIGEMIVVGGEAGVMSTGLAGYRSPRHLGDGVVLAADPRGRLTQLRMDPETGEVIEPPVVRVEELAYSAGSSAAWDIADNGTLVYVGGEAPAAAAQALAWLDRTGTIEVFSERRGIHDVDTRVSPDGQLLALELRASSEDEDVDISVWIHDVQRDVRTALTPGVRSTFPVWSPDSRQIVMLQTVGAEPQGIYRAPVDRSTEPELLLEAAEGRFAIPLDWSPDGRSLLYVESSTRVRSADNDLWVLSLDGGEPTPWLQTSANEMDARISPDGRWVAYVSDHSGDRQIYVRPFPGGGETRVSAEGGGDPEWNSDGSELYFLRGRQMLMVDVSSGDEIGFSAERPLVQIPPTANSRLADPTAEGGRFLIALAGDADEGERSLRAIFNWRYDEAR